MVKKFVTRKADLQPLIEHGLLGILMEKFDHAVNLFKSKPNITSGHLSCNAVGMTDSFVLILPLLGLLCRGSQTITEV